ncbi:hypothetical protein [Lysobacter sp. ESA13C]|uniref:hypothetical protein n=1 Tax=Lysobacter sp. ESA13C TaxID=2862676 RepID=UPI001CBEA17D|nr:hypothetical protein [Lysobacter sp. ESA13C]
MADKVVASRPMAERLTKASAYGVGVIRWGAMPEAVSLPRIFKYQVDFSKGKKPKKMLICTDQPYSVGQKVLFAYGDSRDARCGNGYAYIPATSYNEFVYPVYDDAMNDRSWVQLRPAHAEDLGCENITYINLSLKESKQKGDPNIDFSGIPGDGKYFDLKGLSTCLAKVGISLS